MSQRERVIRVHCPGNAAELAPCSLTLFWTGFAAAAQHEAGERDRTQVKRQDLSLLCIRCIKPNHQGVLAQTPKPPRDEAAHAVGWPQHFQGFCTDKAHETRATGVPGILQKHTGNKNSFPLEPRAIFPRKSSLPSSQESQATAQGLSLHFAWWAL